MKAAILLTILALLTFMPIATALDDNMYISVGSNTTHECFYINLPQDLGIFSANSTITSYIEADKSESPWIDTTYTQVIMKPNVLSKNPVCFYYQNKDEGDFSFYRIGLYSPDLKITKLMKGGLCVSGYDDVDLTNDSAEKNVCDILNENADLFDIQFKYPVAMAKAGDDVTETIYITSYAKLEIDLDIITNLQSDFVRQTISTSSDSPLKTKVFKVTAPSKKGEYPVTIRAKVSGCSLSFCKKDVTSIISVADNITKKGFSLSVIPKSINLKKPGEVWLRLIVTNYDDAATFSVEASSDPVTGIDPASTSIEIGKDQSETLKFNVTPDPQNNAALYTLNFDVTSKGITQTINSYLSVGELFSDARREAQYLNENIDNPDIRNDINNAMRTWENEYENSDYGSSGDILSYDELKKTFDEAKKGNSTGTNGHNGGNNTNNGSKPNPEGFNMWFIYIPIIIVIAMILIFFVYKKSRVVGKFDYPRLE